MPQRHRMPTRCSMQAASVRHDVPALSLPSL
jgi:hypothetical protein